MFSIYLQVISNDIPQIKFSATRSCDSQVPQTLLMRIKTRETDLITYQIHQNTMFNVFFRLRNWHVLEVFVDVRFPQRISWIAVYAQFDFGEVS